MNIVGDKLYISNKILGIIYTLAQISRDKLHPFDRYDASDEGKCKYHVFDTWLAKQVMERYWRISQVAHIMPCKLYYQSVCVCSCVHVCVRVCLGVFVFFLVLVCASACACILASVCVCMDVRVCACVCVGVCLAVWMNLIFRRLLMSLKVRFKAKRLSFSCCLLTITVPHHTITLKMFSQTHT